MSNSDNSDKHRKPDHFVQLIKPGSNGKDQFYDVGQLWNGKDGFMSGNSAAGRIVVISREKREELERMRQEKQLDSQREQDAEREQTFSQEP